MRIEAVIFDFDEVLVKTYKYHVRAFLLAGKKLGYKIKKDDVYRRFGKTARKITEELLPEPSKEKVDMFFKEKEDFYKEMASKIHISPARGVEDLLKLLKGKRIKHAISSSATKKNILINLKKIRLEKYFNTIVAFEDVKHHKPHPEPLLKAAKLLKTRPANCIYIGDSIFEMQAAKSAGMIGVGILTGFYKERDLKTAGASFVFSDMIDVKTFLEKMII